MILGDSIFLLVEIILVTGLIVVAFFAEKYISNVWRIAYLVPFLTGLIFAAFCDLEISLTTAYLGILIPLAGFFVPQKRVRQYTGIVGTILILAAFPIADANPGYRQANYVKDFKEGIAAMEEHYVLAEYKGINFDALYEEYLPRFEAADKHHDEVENSLVWMQFCAEFYDGHVYYVPNHQAARDAAIARMAGNDYGFSIMQLATGKYVAVNVDASSAAYQSGIHNGTVVTLWDGKDISDAMAGIEYSYIETPDKDNEQFYAPLLAAGVGGDEVKVSYLDDSGQEQTITLASRGCFDARMKETLEIIDQGFEAGNMSFTEMDDETVVFRIKAMTYDLDSAQNEDFSEMQNMVREQLLEYKANGKSRLIVDLRCNGGGNGLMVKALAELLADEGEHLYAFDGLWDDSIGNYAVDPATGKYVKGTGIYYMGEDIWSQGQIIILVNGQSASAADALPTLLRGQDNVIVMGFTESCGSGQGVVSKTLESGFIAFSGVVLLDENGDIMIDSGIDHESRNDLDIRVPFDEEAVSALFDRGEDYVLQKALEME